MSIPVGPLKDLLPIYRKAWRDAGHPGDGEVMIAFHMFCHEDTKLAREIPRRQFEDYFSALCSNPPANGRKARRRRITKATTFRSAG